MTVCQTWICPFPSNRPSALIWANVARNVPHFGTLYRMGQENRPVWVCEYEDCGHVWLVSGANVAQNVPDKCGKCRRRGWHKTLTGAELVRQSGAGLDERMAEIARRVFHEEWASVPAESDDEPVAIPSLPVADVSALPVADRLAVARAALASVGAPVGVVLPPMAVSEPCPYTEPDYETGDVWACGLNLGHKVKHTRGRKVGDIW